MNLVQGKERRKIKKQIALNKAAIKREWQFNDFEKVYGGNPLADEEIKKRIAFLEDKIKELEFELRKQA